jgi:hypothetical protein
MAPILAAGLCDNRRLMDRSGRPGPAGRSVAALVAAALLVGCATTRERGRPAAPGEGGGVRVAVYADDDARGAGERFDGAVAGVLERRTAGRWQPVFRSLDPSWAVAGLEPGTYRVRFDTALDASGRPRELSRPVDERVRVREGEVVEVELLLEHVSPALVAAGAVAVVVAAVLLHEWLDGLDLPAPPVPPAWAIETAFWITLEATAEPTAWMPRDRAPQVTSHFPRDGGVLEPDEARVLFSLSEPVDPERLAGAVSVTTEDGEPVAGEVEWDAEHWWVVWRPLEPLARGSRLRATLDGESVVDRVGAPLGRSVRFEFSIAR